MIFSIYRFNPETDAKPRMQDFELDLSKVRGMMLLDAIEALKAVDPTLGIRRSCGGGVCGSDGMNINGKNGLACITPLHQLPEKVVLRPLPGLPVIRDLIVDMTSFYKQYERAKPYLQNDEQPPTTERLQSIEDSEKLDGLYECILCACCTTACPSWWWNPDKFMGPAALLWAYRFIVDTRDNQTESRLAALQDAFSLYRCRTIMNCTTVCPKGLNPAKAIGEIRKEILNEAV
ncbi:MAG: succinate dehydrogenase iron-sulfur subunit [Gammaproteobacteria bacterium]|nr:succinate dehydrogenase iron-sulfur subunit [Gammaproteobacteria bacterium]